jgi:hypothetical protein
MPRREVTKQKQSTSPLGCAALLAVIAAIAVSLVGCSDSSGTSATASQGPLPNAALASKADAICERLRGQLNDADREAGVYTLRQRAKLSELFAAAEERASDQLAALKPQPSEEVEYEKLIALRRALVAYHHKIIKYALQGDKAKVETAYSEYKVAQRKMLNAFKYSRIGFKICWDIG